MNRVLVLAVVLVANVSQAGRIPWTDDIGIIGTAYEDPVTVAWTVASYPYTGDIAKIDFTAPGIYFIDRNDPRLNIDVLPYNYSQYINVDNQLLFPALPPYYPAPEGYTDILVDQAKISIQLTPNNNSSSRLDFHVVLTGTRDGIPEPSSIVLILIGAVVLWRVRIATTPCIE